MWLPRFKQFIDAAAGVGAAAVVDFVNLALISRTLGPAAFGVYGVYLTVMTLVAGVADLGLGILLTKEVAKRGSSLSPVATSIIRLRAGIALALLCAAAVTGSAGGAVSDQPVLLSIALIGAGLTTITTSVSAWLQGLQRFRRNAAYVIGISTTRLLFTAVLIAAGTLSPTTAMAAAAAGPLPSLWLTLRGADWVSVWRTEGSARETIEAAKWLTPWSVLGTVIPRVDVLVVAVLASPANVGYYLAANRLCGVLAMATTTSAIVLQPKLFRSEGGAAIRKTLTEWFVIAIPSALLLLLVTQAFAGYAVELVFGSQFDPTIVIFRILVLGTLLEFLLNPLAYATIQMGRPARISLSHALRLMTLIGLSALLEPTWGALGVATAVAISAVVGLGWLTFQVFEPSSELWFESPKSKIS